MFWWGYWKRFRMGLKDLKLDWLKLFLMLPTRFDFNAFEPAKRRDLICQSMTVAKPCKESVGDLVNGKRHREGQTMLVLMVYGTYLDYDRDAA